MTKEDKHLRQGRSEVQYASTMKVTLISYVGIVLSLLILILINTISL